MEEQRGPHPQRHDGLRPRSRSCELATPPRALRQEFDGLKQDLGYGLLLKTLHANVTDATPEQIRRAALDTIPNVAPSCSGASASWSGWASACWS